MIKILFKEKFVCVTYQKWYDIDTFK